MLNETSHHKDMDKSIKINKIDLRSLSEHE